MKKLYVKIFSLNIDGKKYQGKVSFDSFLSEKDRDNIQNTILSFNLEWSNSQKENPFSIELLIENLFSYIRKRHIKVCKLTLWENENSYYTLKY